MQTLNELPPHDIETEESVLSAMLLYPDKAHEAVELLSPSDFYRTAHQVLFESYVSLIVKNNPVDLPALTATLKETGKMEEIGGAIFLATLMDTAPAAVSMEFCAKKLKGKAILRQTISIANDIHNKAFSATADSDAEAFLDEAQKAITSIEYGGSENNFVPIQDMLEDSDERYIKLSENQGQISGIPTGYFQLDYMLCGFQDSDLIILAARPSMGKTALALNFMRNMAVAGKSSAFFSLEMSKNQINDRLVSMESGVNSLKFRSGKFSKEDFSKIAEAKRKMVLWKIFIDDSPGLSYLEIQRRTRKLAKHNDGINCILVDYLQLIRGNQKNGRVEEVSSISRGLKAMAKEINVPVIALSQLNRALEQRDNKRPKLSDLRDSGAIEQDADVVMFIYRDEVYNQDETNPCKGIAEVNIAKQRTGPVGNISLSWRKETTRFFNLQKGNP